MTVFIGKGNIPFPSHNISSIRLPKEGRHGVVVITNLMHNKV